MNKDIFYDKDIREPLFDFLYGIEIKSDADTYARLEKQVKNYNLFAQMVSETSIKMIDVEDLDRGLCGR